MSILEKIRSVQLSLNNIRVPTAFTESITIPMFNAILALDQICQEIEKQKTEVGKGDIKMEEAPSEKYETVINQEVDS